MAITYTGLIERLRVLARHHGAVAQDGGLLCSRDADAFNDAADAIETLSKSIDAYARANAELTAWKTNAQEWMQKVAEEKDAAERKKTSMHAIAPAHVTTRADILSKAAEAVSGQRVQDHGNPEDNFATIAHLWTAYSGYLFESVDVAMMMALLKIARISSGHGAEDSFVDLAGYAACGGEIWALRGAEK